MNYKIKYLKYKQKYLDIKKNIQIGGNFKNKYFYYFFNSFKPNIIDVYIYKSNFDNNKIYDTFKFNNKSYNFTWPTEKFNILKDDDEQIKFQIEIIKDDFLISKLIGNNYELLEIFMNILKKKYKSKIYNNFMLIRNKFNK